MRLTIEDDPETIRRYAHLRPAARGGRCGARLPSSDRTCTLASDHRGPHVAHGRFRTVVAVWHSVVPARASAEARHRAVEARSQDGLPRRTGPSPWRRMGRWITSLSVEDVALFVLFCAFVGFAVDWFLRILG